jgi:hypothetical protein
MNEKQARFAGLFRVQGKTPVITNGGGASDDDAIPSGGDDAIPGAIRDDDPSALRS